MSIKKIFAALMVLVMMMFTGMAMADPISEVRTVSVTINYVGSFFVPSEIPPITITAVPGMNSGSSQFVISSDNIYGSVTAEVTVQPWLDAGMYAYVNPGSFGPGNTSITLGVYINVPGNLQLGTYYGEVAVTVTGPLQ